MTKGEWEKQKKSLKMRNVENVENFPKFNSILLGDMLSSHFVTC